MLCVSMCNQVWAKNYPGIKTNSYDHNVVARENRSPTERLHVAFDCIFNSIAPGNRKQQTSNEFSNYVVHFHNVDRAHFINIHIRVIYLEYDENVLYYIAELFACTIDTHKHTRRYLVHRRTVSTRLFCDPSLLDN